MRESLFEKMKDAYGLGEKAVQFMKGRVSAIGAKKDLGTNGCALDEACCGEKSEFSLHGADAGFDLAGDLADKEGSIRCAEE